MVKTESYFIWFNSLFAFLISFLYLITTPPSSFLEAIYYVISLFAQISLLTYLVYLPFRILLSSKIRTFLLPFIFSFFILLLLVDTQIYAFFRFHFNLMVWNVLTTEGGWSTLGISHLEIVCYLLGAMFFIALEYKLFFFLQKRKWRIFPNARYILFLVFLQINSTAIYAYGDLYDIYSITSIYQIAPYYQPLTVKRTYHKIYGKLPTPQVDLSVKNKGELKYPLQEIQWEAPKKKYNYIFLIVDCFRLQSFNEEVTPNLWAFSKKSQTFINHYSGGNGTRNGVFSILYGIYSNYWDSFLRQNRSPIFLDRLQELNYNMHVFASTLQSFPEFRKTAFVNISDKINDSYEGQTYEKDKQVLDAVFDYAKKHKDQNFFTYSLLDGAHSAYSFPKTEIKFTPIIDSVTYSTLTEEQKRIHLMNRYLNGLYYVDLQIGKFLKDLDENGILKNTIVVITGDHGDEFMEYGNVGHANAFTPPQIRSPLLVFMPDKEGKTYEHSTIHYDLMATLIPLLGAKNPINDFSHGFNLFVEQPEKDIFVCSWDNCSLVDDAGYMIFGTKSYNAHKVEFRNLDYQVVPKSQGLTPARVKKTTAILSKMSELLK